MDSESHGDGHCGGNNVIDSVLQYAEYRIDYFSRLNVKRLCPFHNFRIVSEYIVDPFLENRNIFFYLFRYVYECCPQFRYYYQHNDHDYTDHKADRKHQTDRPCQFLCCFFLLFQGFSEQMMFYEFHWNIEDKSDSETNDERKEKAKQNSDSADTLQVLTISRYKRIANAMSHRIFFMFSLSSCMFVFPFFLILESIISYFPQNGRLEKYFICYAVSASKRF